MFGKRGEVLLFIGVWIGGVLATVDLELPKVDHLAYHLKKGSCRKLVVVFSDARIDIRNNSYAAKRRMAYGISCLRQLKHGNSRLGEEMEDSYGRVAQGLKVLGHDNLADWLTQNLTLNLKRTLLVNPFVEITQPNETLKSAPKSATPKHTPVSEESALYWILTIITIYIILCCVAEGIGCCEEKKKEDPTESTKKQSITEETCSSSHNYRIVCV
jgi:hypothetical protein